ncbi:hypothetical protein [Cutibacterium avidum]|uniref:hypothetical protein n=1 Tax=Cutibacterium avidum TaxID=33010 RepID=UPI002094E247
MHPTRTLGALSAALAAAVLFAGAPAGHAGPDDGKVVTTEAHVDAPKTYWEDGHFVLKNEAHMTAVPLDGTVNWIGRGYSTLLRPEQKFMFTVPDDPAFAPLSDHGRRWYAALTSPVTTTPRSGPDSALTTRFRPTPSVTGPSRSMSSGSPGPDGWRPSTLGTTR